MQMNERFHTEETLGNDGAVTQSLVAVRPPARLPAHAWVINGRVPVHPKEDEG